MTNKALEDRELQTHAQTLGHWQQDKMTGMTGTTTGQPFTAGTGREGMILVASRCCQGLAGISRLSAAQPPMAFQLIAGNFRHATPQADSLGPAQCRPGFHPFTWFILPEGAVQKAPHLFTGPRNLLTTSRLSFLYPFPSDFPFPFCLPCVFFFFFFLCYTELG
ncbi:hypothetical protein B0T09DRAFT_145976 [Sordaria sp. MPI-SDFR-AT-0083]|nr:hypothetical protein B0T09DRAFT_145976 [Sordaria sp. MPI-SDFR-AT-0083]